MKNKKGSGFLQFILNAAVIFAFIYAIIFLIVGGGGGFTALFKVGQFFGGLPTWVLGILVIGFIYLIIGGKK